MADNVTVDNGGLTDYTVAADDDGTAQHQYVKLEWGPDNTQTKVNTGAAAVPIQDGGNSITVDGTVTTTPSGDHTVVGKAADGAATSGNPVLIAGQDGTNVQSLKTDTNGELQVDVLTLPALSAGTNNIGDVDVLTVPAPLSTTGSGTEATALRVTVATDSTGVLSVDDNGSTLTVDAPVGTPVNVQVGDGTRTATVRDTGTSDSLNVAIVDASGNQVTSFGGGTQYVEDDAAAANPTGTVPILIRDDTPNTQTTTDGDNIAQRGTNYGAAYVQVVTSSGSFVDSFGGSGGTAQADESAFTEGTTNMTPIGGVLNDTITSDPTEDQAAAVRITAKRAFHANLRNVGGTEIGTGTDPVRVDPTGTTTQPVSNTVLSVTGGGTEAAAQRVTIANDSTGVLSVDDNGGSLTVDGTVAVSGTVTVADASLDNTTLVDNAAFTDGTTRVQMGGFIYDEVAGTALTENDAAAARINTNRAQVGIIEDGTTRARYATVTASNALKVDGSAATQPVSGTVSVSGTVTVADASLDNATLVDNAAFTDGTTRVQMAGFILDDTAGTALTENDAAAARISTNRAVVGVIEDGATRARYATVSAANALKVDGSAVTQPVSGTVTANQGTAGTAWEVVGDVANDVAVPANPIVGGGRASTAVPTAVSADGDAVYEWLTRNGAPVVTMAPHVGIYRSTPWNLVSETAQYTTTQTSTVLVAGGVSEGLVVTYIQIQAGGTTAGTVQVYFGTGAYSRGTNYAIFDGEFAPSATLKPGFTSTGPFISATNGDDILVTTSAAINPLTITVWYYVVT